MLCDKLERLGAWLFRWRSYLPFLVLLLALFFIRDITQRHLHDEHLEHRWLALCYALTMLGVLSRALIVGFVPRNTSGRNTRAQKAASLNTTGAYSLVRHPIYVANYLVFAGFILMFRSPELFILASLIYALYYLPIMMAEERFLYETFGARYRDYASRTNAVLPSIRNWKRPALPFSLRTVIRREASTLLLASFVFAAYDAVEDLLVEREALNTWLRDEWFWPRSFLLIAALYLIARHLKRHTSLLAAQGR